MKTKMMSSGSVPEQYKKHLQELGQISIDKINIFVDWLLQADSIDGVLSELDDDLISQLSQKTSLSAGKLIVLANAIGATYGMLIGYGDNPEDFVDDLLYEKIIDQEIGDRLKNALGRLKGKPFRKKRGSEIFSGVLPSYDDSDSRTRCVLIPHFEKEYSVRDTPETYSSVIDDLVPAVVIKIGANDKEMKVNSFAMTEKDLDSLLNRLLLAKKQLQIFTTHIGILKSTNQNGR